MCSIVAYTWVAAVRVVVPVVVVGNEVFVGTAFRETQEVTLAVVPEVVVREGNVVRLLTVEGTVALCLVGIRTGIAVEHVAVVNPDVLIVLLQTNIVTLVAAAVHETDVAYLSVACTLQTDTPSVGYGIIADTLDGNACAGILAIHVDDDVALVARAGDTHVTENTEYEGTRLVAFLQTGQDALQACTLGHVLIGTVHIYLTRHVVLVGIGDVDNLCITLQCTVGIVCTGSLRSVESIAGAVVCTYFEVFSHVGSLSLLFTIYYRHHLQLV